MNYSVYILKLSDGSYYTGYTKNLENRLNQHAAKRGSKYVRSRLPLVLVHEEKYETRSDAMRREIQIKKFSRKQKQYLVSKDLLWNHYRSS
ncbi:MAG: GIY-YIG nuclease family protein [Candidatus Kariarchaeaceae archaeon]